MTDAAVLRWGGLASIAYGIAVVAVDLVNGLIVHMQVPDSGRLLDDVARARTAWVGAEAVLIAAQVLLVPWALALAVTLGRSAPRARLPVAAAAALAGLGGVLMVLSGVFHGVLGVHLAGPAALRTRPREDLLRDVELVHALGDTSYFVGLVALGLVFVVLARPLRRDPAFPDGLSRLGVVAAVVGGLQFLWFVLPDAAVAAPVFAVLLAGWFGWLGLRLVAMAADQGDSHPPARL